MYTLTFNKNKSKYFNQALSFAKELNCDYDGETITIRIPDESLLSAYEIMRTLFSFIQKWKDTKATYNNKKVAPYPFILNLYFISRCLENVESEKLNCTDTPWGCKRINNISYNEVGNGEYKKNGRYWYNYGYFSGKKWIINKTAILDKLLGFVYSKTIHLCPLLKEDAIRFYVDNLPDYIIPNNLDFKVSFKEKYVGGQKVMIPENIRHIPKLNNNSMRMQRVCN